MTRRIIISVTNDIAYDQRMQKTASTLIKNGFNVKIIGRLKSTSTPFNSPNFELHRFSMYFHKGKLFYLEYNIRLLLYLLIHKADIFCAVDLDTILPNIIVGKLKNKPIIYDAHEYFTEVPELEGRILEKKIWKWIEKLCIPQCTAMYTVSQSIAELFTKEYHIPCEVIYNFPKFIHSFPLPNEIKSSTPFIFIYQGDLNEGRGLDIVLKSLPYLQHTELWIIGDGYERVSLEKLSQQLNLEERVKFYGYIPPIDLIQYTAKAHLGLNLLENKGLNHYYSLANKHFDYIQSSIPPISMNFPEYKRFDNQYPCAILLEELTIEAFVNQVQIVLNDKNNYSELVKNCDIARRFLIWEAQEEKLSSIYRNV